MKYFSKKYLILTLFFPLLLFGGYYLYQFYWESQIDYTHAVRNRINSFNCQQTSCQIPVQNIDKWIYFSRFNSNFDDSCHGLMIDNKVKAYIKEDLTCEYLVGFKENHAQKFLKGQCLSANDEDTIFFRKEVSSAEIENIEKANPNLLYPYLLASKVQTGDVFNATIVHGKKFDGNLYALTLTQTDNLANLDCFSISKNF